MTANEGGASCKFPPVRASKSYLTAVSVQYGAHGPVLHRVRTDLIQERHLDLVEKQIWLFSSGGSSGRGRLEWATLARGMTASRWSSWLLLLLSEDFGWLKKKIAQIFLLSVDCAGSARRWLS